MTGARPLRDLRGYAGVYPDVRWPGGAALAVSLVLNIEEGAEWAIGDGDERNEATHEVRHEIAGVPDLCMQSHFEYGARVGYWRIAAIATRLGVPLTLNACGRAVERTPWIAADAVARGFEICCHGWRWESHAGLAEDDERARIARTVAAIRAAAGVTPVGWHTKSSPSVNTRRLLSEAGFLYDSDAYNDDCPYWVEAAGRPHLVLPYAFDTNDMRFFDSQSFVHADDFADYVFEAFERLRVEGSESPRMLSIGLHTRIIGRPARIGGLERLIERMKKAGGAWFATREAIARHWIAQCPAPRL